MTLENSKYKDIKDLDGKSIGIYSSKNSTKASNELNKKIKNIFQKNITMQQTMRKTINLNNLNTPDVMNQG